MADNDIDSALDCGDIILDDVTNITNRKCIGEVATYSIRRQADRLPCLITSACVIEQGFILLVDHNNSKLVCVEMATLSIWRSCLLNNKPWSVCCTNHREVAVSVPDRNLVQWYQLRDTLTLVKSLKLAHPFKTLAYHEGELFVAGPGSMVYVYTTSGTPLRHFSTNLQQDEESLFQCMDMTLSDKADILFIAYMGKGLAAIDHSNGNLCWQAGSKTEQDGERVRSVCTDGCGGVYVSDVNDSKLRKFNEVGSMEDTIPLDCSCPYVLCFDNENNRVLVIEEGADNVYAIHIKLQRY